MKMMETSRCYACPHLDKSMKDDSFIGVCSVCGWPVKDMLCGCVTDLIEGNTTLLNFGVRRQLRGCNLMDKSIREYIEKDIQAMAELEKAINEYFMEEKL